MRVVNVQVFDDSISGLTNTRYTPAEYNDILGRGDQVTVLVYVSQVNGTSGTLTVAIQHSADGENWANTGSQIVWSLTAPVGTNVVTVSGLVPVLLSFVRCKITMGGTNPGCRLKLVATGRSS